MLQLIRDRAQGIVVWTIVGLIIVTFALFGLGSYLSGSATVNVATIDGTEISQTEFLRAYQNYQQRLQQMLGKNYRADLFDEAVLKQEVLNGLVTRQVLTQSIDDSGFNASPKQVLEKIQAIGAFKDETGEFSNKQYKRTLALQGLNSTLFEQQIERDIADENLQAGLISSAFVTEKQLNNYLRLQGQTRDIDYIQVKQDAFQKTVAVSGDEIKQYYEANLPSYTTEELVSIEYIELDINQQAKSISVSDDDVEAYYQQNRKQYQSKPEQRKASHILVEDEATAKDLLAKVKAGESFAELAKVHSKDPGSAKQGGDLGFFGKGVMDKAFEESVFTLNKGDVSEPVKSTFGYHLIKLVDIKEGEIKPLKDVRNDIVKSIQLQNVEQQYYADVDKLNNLSYETPDSLAPVADALALKVKTTSLFGRRGGPGILANPKVVNASFTKEVLNQGRNSELLELSDTHVVVLRIKDHKPSAPRAISEVGNIIRTQLTAKKASEEAMKAANEINSKLQAGDSVETVIKANSAATLNKVGFVARKPQKEEKQLNSQVRQAAFSMAKPSAKATTKLVALNTGDYAIVLLNAVQDAIKPSDANNQAMESAYMNAGYNSYIEYLKEQADIKIFAENIQSKQ